MRGCAGWSAPVLFATPRRQVFSCRGPNNTRNKISPKYTTAFLTIHLQNTYMYLAKCKKVNSDYTQQDYTQQQLHVAIIIGFILTRQQS